MCGIFGYVGKEGANQRVIQGLKRLEYRGYDSWGIAVKHNGSIDLTKKVGAIGDIDLQKDKLKAYIGIGHTRWATHGGVTEWNAHPHFASDRSFVLAQNGIVENYQELKKQLSTWGHAFTTDTDTEVIVRLIEEKRKKDPELTTAVRKAFLDLKGRNTIIVLNAREDHIIAVRNGSPLVVGIGDNEYFISSDTLSFADQTDNVILMDDMQMIEYLNGTLTLYNAKTGKKIDIKTSKLDHKTATIDKEGFEHFMLKEIVEQKDTIREAVQYSLTELRPLIRAIRSAGTVYTVGAGTAGFAAGQIAYFLRKYATVHATELRSYEIDSYRDLFTRRDLLIAVSQSGETADTIEAIEQAKTRGTRIASIVNMVGSTITRMSDYQYLSRSGPEICVASTKAYTAQLAWGLVLAHAISGKYSFAKKVIENTSQQLGTYFSEELFSQVKVIAARLKRKDHFFILGRGQHYYTALEGSLKVKEITYKHFEGFAAGELKHGVIALIEKDTPVFVIVSNDSYKDDMLTAAAEVNARGAWTIGVSSEENELFDDFLPGIDGKDADPITKIIPFQLLSYFLGVELGNNVDRPRNLAKSVTVK